MANREQRRRRRKEQHRARRQTRRLGFDPQATDEWAALIAEANVVGIRDLISLPDRILNEIGSGQAVRTARALMPPKETGLTTLGLDDWEKFLGKVGAPVIERVVDLITSACFALISHQSAKARSDGIDGINTTPGSANLCQLDDVAERCGLQFSWDSEERCRAEATSYVVIATSMLVVERFANVGRFGNDVVTVNLRAGQINRNVLVTGPSIFAPRAIEIDDTLTSLRGTTVVDPATGETGEFNALGVARHILDNAEDLILEHGHRLAAEEDNVPPWWFFPATGLHEVDWIGYRFDNRVNGGVLRVVAGLAGAQEATGDQDIYDWAATNAKLTPSI